MKTKTRRKASRKSISRTRKRTNKGSEVGKAWLVWETKSNTGSYTVSEVGSGCIAGMIRDFFFFFWPYHAAWGGLSSLTREQTHAPAVEMRNLNRWNAREVLAMKRISKSYCWYRSKLVGNCSLSPLAATVSFPTKHLICTWSPYCPHLQARRCQWGSSPDPGLSPSRHPTFPRSYWR